MLVKSSPSRATSHCTAFDAYDDADALNPAFAVVPRLIVDREAWVKFWERREDVDMMAG